MCFDAHALLAAMAKRRPVFHSEADFQHEFAWEVRQQLPQASIRLEKPLKAGNGVAHLDVLIQHHGDVVAIELKYKTSSLSMDIADESYNLRNHGAQDLGRYDFVKDISRLESIASSHPGTRGYAVLLTNDNSYWRAAPRVHTVDAAFRLHEGRMVAGSAAWGTGASPGTTKSRDKPLHLHNAYKLQWQDYSSPLGCDGPQFRYLLVSVPALPYRHRSNRHGPINAPPRSG